MSKSDLLYVRNMIASEESEEEVENNVLDTWDDMKLNNAYQKALSTANVDVAQRLAMSTNTMMSKNGYKTKKTTPKPASKSPKKDRVWKAGMHCRAVYEEDGVEYEAFLMRIFNDTECVVRFLGYENSEIVTINSLKPSLGKRERNKQIDEALADNLEDGISIHSSHTVEHIHTEEMNCSERHQSSESLASLKKKTSKKNKPKRSNKFTLPELSSMPMPNLADLRNAVARDMPLPPPPLVGFQPPRHDADCDDQAISSMLFSWYMSGYYTGLYQGRKRTREEKKHQ